MKLNLFLGKNCFIDGFNILKHRLILHLHAVAHVNAARELLGLLGGTEGLQVADQLVCASLGKKAAALHFINQKLQL